MANNNGGPWGGGGGRNGGDNRGGDNRGGRRPGGPGDNGQIPEIDEIMKKGQEQLRVLMGGRGGGSNGRGPGGGGGPRITKGTVGLAGIAILGLWLYSSFYTVRPEEQSVELFLGEFSAVGNPGLNFAPWPLVTAEVLPVTRENTEEIGTSRNGARGEDGLMLTTDENIVDIDFDVVWNISDPAAFLFNLRDGQQTVRAVSEASMREVIARSELAPILNRDRELIAQQVQDLIQTTLDSYDSGINIVRLNLDRADPPEQVIDAFREVQAAEQERDRLERQADAYANRVLAGARGEAAQLLEQAEAYRAQVVNEAEGEASRFTAVLAEYQNAPEVTRKRLYLETMERVLGGIDKVILDEGASGGQGVVPYLPINELRRSAGETN
ncbi:Protein HflK [Dinoroseobacter shibae DFL 12 = DSM 16493]|jgi:membrane protease subunit HflK|uniref:Protein HflK n=1 Tax=Dinoroseobacter shibae (strain DSM 16493 / NCIMB 14021 / DFL 12) TaxID=398580 RepID=A8LIM8_DINSH|nr:FtsH protease activity modulator HflK [Dinoroseobacter shibae]ABV94469.1 Protein HflK [Dinoroseobacter shibae DFL 12 = DSM 16493]URF45894.1 FtsH protease activity modulator HflK [Dinoroseobacter shibae]URF50200.1 FtsH protease activity modulator HflK [Dinoroseobacter shibae]